MAVDQREAEYQAKLDKCDWSNGKKYTNTVIMCEVIGVRIVEIADKTGLLVRTCELELPLLDSDKSPSGKIEKGIQRFQIPTQEHEKYDSLNSNDEHPLYIEGEKIVGVTYFEILENRRQIGCVTIPNTQQEVNAKVIYV